MHRRSTQIILDVFVVLTILALALSTVAVVDMVRQADRRERERIAGDYESCERGNEFRAQVRSIAEAGAQLDRDVLAGVFRFAEFTPDEEAEIWALLAPAFDEFDLAVADIGQVDCRAVVAGGA